jgi:hypothetical protein
MAAQPTAALEATEAMEEIHLALAAKVAKAVRAATLTEALEATVKAEMVAPRRAATAD